MIAPDVDRPDTPLVASERQMLEAFLDFHRATLLRKCAGLTDEQLKLRACPPSALSLLGLVRHLTDVENGWFGDFDGRMSSRYATDENPDGDFEGVDDADAAADLTAFRAEWARSNQTLAKYTLDDSDSDSQGKVYSLRWIYFHMLEEYARHNGHADLLREKIDGTVGE
ncbi:MAG TPA: DinB family protein [Actinomycetes bacterium]|nr:DinB family protein [Actinomycetes bacterium]